jgi:hypothetical protein
MPNFTLVMLKDREQSESTKNLFRPSIAMLETIIITTIIIIMKTANTTLQSLGIIPICRGRTIPVRQVCSLFSRQTFSCP